MFGCGSVAQVVLSRGTHGGFLTINLAFGFAVTLGILIAGQVSGEALFHPQSILLGASQWGRGGGTFPRAGQSGDLGSEPWEEGSGEGTQ